MSLLDIVTLFFIVLTLAIVPSSSVVLVVSRSVAFGFLNGVAA